MSNKKPPVPTLDDVARLAGVSKAVASRALSGKDRPISADKKNRVIEAANTLGYVANPFARSLINNSTGLIAIVVNHIADISDLTLFDALIQAIQGMGKQSLFVRLRSNDDIVQIKRNPFVYRVDAALIFSDLIEPDEAPGLFYTDRIIMLNGKTNPSGLSVTIDESHGIGEAVAYASAQRIHRVVMLCGRKTSLAERQRIRCYQHAMDACGIALDDLVYCDYAYQNAMTYLQSQSYSDTTGFGVFCTSDAMALAAIDYFRIKSPAMIEHRSILGFDNTPFSQLGSYQFPTIGYCKHQFIDQVVQLLEAESFSDGTARHVAVGTTFYPR